MPGLTVLAVIPARGGSKGVPGKNLREVAGVPLVVHAIQAAREATGLDAFVVSTDDRRIAEVARAAGAAVVMRPAELAGDESAVAEALVHALAAVEADGSGPFDAVVVLQPTAPLRSGAHVDEAIERLDAHPAADSVVSVCALEDVHPARMYRLGAGDAMEPLWPEWERSHRQDLPRVYQRNGAIYVVRRALLLDEGLVIGHAPAPYVMSAQLLANIDDERDLLVADALMRAWQAGRLPA